tara:strand:- start:1787 stop:1981 length:195 start_codon:yes stop_codon:yes gene_type:complete
MRTTDQKEKVIQLRSDKDLSSSSAKSFKAMVGNKRMSIIVMNGESKDEVEKKLIEKFAEDVVML